MNNFLYDTIASFKSMSIEDVGNIGNLLTGIAATLALMLSRPTIKFWRQQKLLERKSEVAMQAYKRFARFVDAIKFVSNTLITDLENDIMKKTTLTPPFAAVFGRRREIIHSDTEKFIEIWAEVELLFDPDIDKLFETAWNKWASIQGNFATFCQIKGSAKETQEFWNKAMGSTVASELNELRTKARTALSRHAQMLQSNADLSQK